MHVFRSTIGTAFHKECQAVLLVYQVALVLEELKVANEIVDVELISW